MTRPPIPRPAPDFDPIAPAYARARPRYPEALYAWLAGEVDRHELAWDAATGNGQAAVGLASRFARVLATDRSAGQIEHAERHPRIEYRVAPAEASGLASASVDLAVVATALHWLPHDEYFAEVERVVRPGGVFAAWTYHAGTCDPPFDGAIHRFYWEIARPHFAQGVAHVDEGYARLAFPGTAIETPPFRVVARWTFAQVVDYLRSWSGVAGHLAATGEDLVAAFAPELARLFRDPAKEPDEALPFCMPITLVARRL